MIIRRMYDWPRLYSRGPFQELERMKTQMERLFEGLTEGLPKMPTAGVFPLLNVTEDRENFYVRAELPGIKAEDLDISITGNSLAISGEKKISAEAENAKYHRKEREGGKFSRMVDLPGQIDLDEVEAKVNNGVLSILLPKSGAAKPKQISVK